MKKVRNYTLIVAIVVGVFILAGIIGRIEAKYSRIGFVESEENGVATIEDAYGLIWEVDNPDLVVGETVVMEMHTAGTSAIEDDVILEVKEAQN